MAAKSIAFNTDARERILRGVQKLAERWEVPQIRAHRHQVGSGWRRKCSGPTVSAVVVQEPARGELVQPLSQNPAVPVGELQAIGDFIWCVYVSVAQRRLEQAPYGIQSDQVEIAPSGGDPAHIEVAGTGVGNVYGWPTSRQ